MTKADRQSELEREMEQARQRLAGTIDQLIYRAKPKTITQRQIAAVKARYVDPATGQPNMAAIFKTTGIVVGVLGVMIVLRRLNK